MKQSHNTGSPIVLRLKHQPFHKFIIIWILLINLFATQPVHETPLSQASVATPQPSVSPAAPPSPTPGPTPTPTPTTTKKISAQPGSKAKNNIGIAVGLADLSTADLNRSLDDIKNIGVTWVRFDVDWSNIEADGPGKYNWAAYDRVAQGITSRGLYPLAIIDYTPEWARQSGCTASSKCAPANPDAFAQFAGLATTRYAKMGVHHWEVWNEPNVNDYFQPSPNAALYTTILKGAYTAIKRADPGATVLTAGTAPAASDDVNINARDFLTAIYANGGKGYFDAVAHHPYTYPYTVNNAYPGGAWSDLEALHTIMVRHGDGAKLIWATEYGAPTGGPGELISGGNGPFTDSVYVSEALQSAMVTTALARYRTYAWTGPLFWYTYQDASNDPSTIENFFGLIRANGSRKPAYAALKAAIK